MKKAVGFIGGGNMAKAILSGLSQQKERFDLYLCECLGHGDQVLCF